MLAYYHKSSNTIKFSRSLMLFLANKGILHNNFRTIRNYNSSIRLEPYFIGHKINLKTCTLSVSIGIGISQEAVLTYKGTDEYGTIVFRETHY